MRSILTILLLIVFCRSVGAATLATDNFNRADAADLGAAWDVQTGTQPWKILTNAVTPNSLGSDSEENNNSVTWPDDQYSQAKITVTSTTAGDRGAGVMCRAATGAWTNYRLVVSHAASANVNLSRRVAGTRTALANRTVTWVDGDVLRLEVTGTGANIVLKIFQNGSQLGADVADASGGIDSGRAGITYSSSTSAPTTLDDWEGGSIVAPGNSAHYYRMMSSN